MSKLPQLCSPVVQDGPKCSLFLDAYLQKNQHLHHLEFTVLCYSCMPCLPRMNKSFVYTLCQAIGANSLPHQPQLQTVHFAAALQRLIPAVEIHIIEFVLLKQVCGVGAVALLQQVLRTNRI